MRLFALKTWIKRIVLKLFSSLARLDFSDSSLYELVILFYKQ